MSHDTSLPTITRSAGKRPATDLEIVGVANLKPSDVAKAICVRVYRKWTVTDTRGIKQPTLSVILLDQQGGAIQANAEGREKARFDNILQINAAYTITGFGLLDTKKWMQTLPNHFTLILGRVTDVQPYTGTSFPLHHFNFATYTQLHQRADKNNEILTDYIACVLSVGDIREPKAPNTKQIVWRDIILRNLEGDTVRFTLWNEKAHEFSITTYEKEPKPTVMAVSSCWVKTYKGLQLSSTPATYYYFNPPIPETDYILSMYEQLLPPPVIQNVRTYSYDNIEDEKKRNRVTIDELLREDPRNQTNVRFTVVATIEQVVVGIPWFYRRCHDCRRKIFDDRPHAQCEIPAPTQPSDYSYSFRLLISDNTGVLTLTCFSNEVHSIVTEVNKVVSEEGYTDAYTVPPHLTALEGTTHLFQLHFSPDSTKENQSYVLDSVMETGPHLLLPTEQNIPLLTGAEAESPTEEGTTSEPPVTPASPGLLQTSTPTTIEATSHLQGQATKTEVLRTSARRRILTENKPEENKPEETSNAAKKPKTTVRK